MLSTGLRSHMFWVFLWSNFLLHHQLSIIGTMLDCAYEILGTRVALQELEYRD